MICFIAFNSELSRTICSSTIMFIVRLYIVEALFKWIFQNVLNYVYVYDKFKTDHLSRFLNNEQENCVRQ